MSRRFFLHIIILRHLLTHFEIRRDFFGFIVGPNGVTRTRIQNETATSIVIPRGSGNIYIRGPTRDSVRKARQEIELIVASSRDKLYTNHLNTVRITVEAIRDNYLQFKVGSQSAVLCLRSNLICCWIIFFSEILWKLTFQD